MASFAQLALRGSQFLWTLLTLSLIGNVIAEQSHGRSYINYAIFVSVWDMLVVFWGLAAAFKEGMGMGFFLTIADISATLFTVIAGIVLAAKLRVHSCGNQSYIHSNHAINASPNHLGKACHELQASTAFYWFAFASFLGSVIIGAMSGSGPSFRGGRGGVRRGPAMSQV